MALPLGLKVPWTMRTLRRRLRFIVPGGNPRVGTRPMSDQASTGRLIRLAFLIGGDYDRKEEPGNPIFSRLADPCFFLNDLTEPGPEERLLSTSPITTRSICSA